MVGCSHNPTWDWQSTRTALPRKRWLSLPGLNLLGALLAWDFPSFLFFSTALSALRIRFSSSELEARSSRSDSYSCATCQPSLLRSANFISFWRFFISCWPSSISCRISEGLSMFSSILLKMLLRLAFSSNCFRLPLNFNSLAPFWYFRLFFYMLILHFQLRS